MALPPPPRDETPASHFETPPVAPAEPGQIDATAGTNPGEESGSLPVPAGPLYNEHDLTPPGDAGAKPSLWKRFRMRARGESSSPTRNTPKLARDPQVGIRLDSIERKIDDFDTTLNDQLDALHARLEDVWESEEQLSHLADIQDKLDRLGRSHAELVRGIGSLRRSMLGLVVLMALTALASALAPGWLG